MVILMRHEDGMHVTEIEIFTYDLGETHLES